MSSKLLQRKVRRRRGVLGRARRIAPDERAGLNPHDPETRARIMNPASDTCAKSWPRATSAQVSVVPSRGVNDPSLASGQGQRPRCNLSLRAKCEKMAAKLSF